MKKYLISMIVVVLLLSLPCIFTETSFVENPKETVAVQPMVTPGTDLVSPQNAAAAKDASGIPADAECGDAVKTQLVIAYSDDSLTDDEHFLSFTNDYYLLEYATAEEAAAAAARFAEDEKAAAVENPIVLNLAETDMSSSLDASKSDMPFMTDPLSGTGQSIAATYLSYGPEAIDADTFQADLLTKYNSIENMPEIVVGVVDTGIDTDHAFLSGRILKYSDNFITPANNAEDDNGHGTHVAGTIADTTFDNVKLNAYKVADNYGYGTDYSVASGINAAVADGVDIINVSMCGQGTSTVLNRAVADATAADVLICVASGNTDTDADACVPASCPGAFTVAAVNSNLERASFSNYGDCVDIAAPGVNINSSYVGGSYLTKTGTSMATPFVSAAGALLLSYDADTALSEIEHLLSSYAVDCGTAGRDEYYGYGVLDLSYIVSGNCVISFDANGGSKVNDVLTVPVGSICPTLPTTTLKGNTFVDWYSSDGALLRAGDTIGHAGRLILKAFWELGKSTIYFDANGGSCDTASKIVAYNSTYGSLPTPTKPGYTFAGWYTSAGLRVTSASVVADAAEITLTAKWNILYYAINVVNGENGSISPSSSSQSYGSSRTFTITPNSGYVVDQVKVDGINLGAITSYTFANITSNHTISATFAWNNPYADVSSSAWYYNSVQKTMQWGLFTGTSPSQFSPDAAMTRAMLVTVLYRYEGSPAVSGSTPFTDLSQSYYYNAVLWASQNGIVTGTSATTFSPDASVTRQQMVVFLYRYCGNYKKYNVSAAASLSGYSDANQISSYALDAMKWAVAKGYIKGTSATALSPQVVATRAQVAEVLVKFIESL